MRILIYSYNYAPEPIGIAPLMTELAEGLVQRGHEVRVVTGMPNYPERQVYPEYRGKFYVTEIKQQVLIQRSYIYIKGPKPGLLDRLLLDGSFMLSSVVQAFRGWRPDIVFATIPPLPISIPVSFFSYFRGCPTILNLQDIVSEAAVRVGLLKRESMLFKLAESLETLAYSTSERISAIAEGFREKLIEQGIDDRKITCIPNWVDINFIQPLPQEPNSFRTEHALNSKFVVLYAGNIALTQGLSTVIEAAKQLQSIVEIQFVIVGEEKALSTLQQECDRIGATNVILLPFQPRENLPQMYAAANLSLVIQKERVTAFNLPSKIPLILASGRAIVASVPADGTAAKAVRDSQGGVVVPPEDATALATEIKRLYRDPDEAEGLGKQGREYAIANFSLEQALNRYEALFTEAIASYKAR
ncbi:glycosyltransferase family 4 protein [Roseofilum casamattae]|uniref:Glycosyltransferase family 4 protein n=1 Tax=Roseofilum casamattae BLCC-M143 TaxID=3022442 RepID=A0ABT7BUW9_9CYAN|nr:glycosyltransferase family 4 protein [Roseofilum casamattae]MDJ1182984.1 glycosyltransferase family 4 protein [Roseofilum casamattae BLCC-M143]